MPFTCFSSIFKHAFQVFFRLFVPAEILSRGKMLSFTGNMMDSTATMNFHYVNPATWIVHPVSNLLVKVNEQRMKAYLLGEPKSLSKSLLDSSCLSQEMHDAWQELDADYIATHECAGNTCEGHQPYCILSANAFWRLAIEDPQIIEVGGVLCGLISGAVILYAACNLLLWDLSGGSMGRAGRCYTLLEKAIAVPTVLATFAAIAFTLLMMHDSVSVACILTPLASAGMLPATKMMCWLMAAQVGESLALIAYGATQEPFSEGIVQMAWVQLFCSILAILLTALPFVRKLASHCGFMIATACHEFIALVAVCALSIPASLLAMYALTVLWDSSPSFTVCILLVILPLVISGVVWLCLRADWLLPADVREEVKGECECETAASPRFLMNGSQMSPVFAGSPPSARTQPARSPSPAPTSPLSPMPNLEIIEEDVEREAVVMGPKTTPLPVMPVPRPGGSDNSSGEVEVPRLGLHIMLRYFKNTLRCYFLVLLMSFNVFNSLCLNFL